MVHAHHSCVPISDDLNRMVICVPHSIGLHCDFVILGSGPYMGFGEIELYAPGADVADRHRMRCTCDDPYTGAIVAQS